MKILKVSSKSEPKSVAGAIAALMEKEGDTVELRAIGAGAANQSLKAAIIARGFAAQKGLNLIVIPAFMNVQESLEEERTGIKLIVKAS